MSDELNEEEKKLTQKYIKAVITDINEKAANITRFEELVKKDADRIKKSLERESNKFVGNIFVGKIIVLSLLLISIVFMIFMAHFILGTTKKIPHDPIKISITTFIPSTYRLNDHQIPLHLSITEESKQQLEEELKSVFINDIHVENYIKSYQVLEDKIQDKLDDLNKYIALLSLVISTIAVIVTALSISTSYSITRTVKEAKEELSKIQEIKNKIKYLESNGK